MAIALMILSAVLIIISILPFIQNQHWVFRVPEFVKLQLLLLQTVVFTVTFWFVGRHPELWYFQAVQAGLMAYHIAMLMRYTRFWKNVHHKRTPRASDDIKIIACNVYQPNTNYAAFIRMIQEEKPDIFMTMESNAGWEQAMRVLEGDYPTSEKVTLENTYGMHFYTNLKVHRIQTHYFVADDLPSIEAELETRDGHRFIFFGVHPPPPSPTEEETSKERDGDLLSVAKKVRDYKLPVVVSGDFNNVAWAKSSVLFKKTSRLIDARIGRGILATFHAKYWFFRVPLDLLFHSPDVFVDQLMVHPSIGSDHFPVSCTWYIDLSTDKQEEDVKHLEAGEMQEVNELIREGQAEESDNR